jgi:hypothetical protein
MLVAPRSMFYRLRSVMTHDYRFWWALFVFFAALGVLVVQRRYRWWRRAKEASAELTGESRIDQQRRVRLEGWRLAMMTASLLVMTGLVFGVFLGAPPPVVLTLRLLAILSVLGVVLLSLRL